MRDRLLSAASITPAFRHAIACGRRCQGRVRARPRQAAARPILRPASHYSKMRRVQQLLLMCSRRPLDGRHMSPPCRARKPAIAMFSAADAAGRLRPRQLSRAGHDAMTLLDEMAMPAACGEVIIAVYTFRRFPRLLGLMRASMTAAPPSQASLMQAPGPRSPHARVDQNVKASYASPRYSRYLPATGESMNQPPVSRRLLPPCPSNITHGPPAVSFLEVRARQALITVSADVTGICRSCHQSSRAGDDSQALSRHWHRKPGRRSCRNRAPAASNFKASI